jgi:hypothetical protein
MGLPACVCRCPKGISITLRRERCQGEMEIEIFALIESKRGKEDGYNSSGEG